MKKVYFDHNATTPVRSEVFEAIKPVLTEYWGNPSSPNWAGSEAVDYLDEARGRVAQFIGADDSEVVFTACGSESDNLAIKGIVEKYAHKGGHIITTSVEHPAVWETCKYLEKKEYPVTYLGVDSEGMVDLDEYRDAFRDDTVLVTVMMANNENGTVFPIKDMAAYANERGVFFHTDAVQAVGKIPVDVKKLGVDMLSLSGHKIYAPKGVGALYVRNGINLEKLIHGGGQEGGRRAGTENVAGAVALGKACELAGKELPETGPRILELRKRLEEGIVENIENVTVTSHPSSRLPNTSNVIFNCVEGESILLSLDMEGVAVSSGSACASGAKGPSRALLSMGITLEDAQSAIRFSLGKDNTADEVDFILDILPPIVHRLRSMSPLNRATKV